MSLKASFSFLAIAGVICGTALAGNDNIDKGWHGKHEKYTIALFGDMPYNALGKQQYPNLIADINNSHVAFSVFDGDLKAGGDGPCTDENLYFPALANFRSFKVMALYVFRSARETWLIQGVIG